MLLTRSMIRDQRFGGERDSCTKILCARTLEMLRAALAPRIFIRCLFILPIALALTWKLSFPEIPTWLRGGAIWRAQLQVLYTDLLTRRKCQTSLTNEVHFRIFLIFRRSVWHPVNCFGAVHTVKTCVGGWYGRDKPWVIPTKRLLEILVSINPLWSVNSILDK